MNKIKAVLFDIGNVLVFFSHDQMVRQLGSLYKASDEEVREALFGSGLGAQIETGNITTPGLHKALNSRFKQELHIEHLKKASGNIFWENSSIYPIVHALKKQNIRLILLSNVSELHWHHLRENYPIFKAFDGAALSFEVGAMKPERAIFEAAISAAECEAEECFYIDDIEDYVYSAKELGIDAVCYKDTEKLLAQLRKRLVL